MKYLILITTLLFLSCDVTEPEFQETFNCEYIYCTENGVFMQGFSTIGNIIVNGVEKNVWDVDYIKATVKSDKVVFYEIYYGDHYQLKEAITGYKYFWSVK
jgi:hypothetical protein